MKDRHLKEYLSTALFAFAFVQVFAQSVEDIPHRIIQGLHYDWPTAVICLKQTDSRSYVRLLRPRLSTYARLSAVPEGNVLVATVSHQRMPVLLKTIAALDRNGVAPSEAIKLLPSTYEKSLEQPEPEQPETYSDHLEQRYVPEHLSPGRVGPYLQMYGNVPIMLSSTHEAVLIEGDATKVNAQLQLARSVDVADYDHCVELNGT